MPVGERVGEIEAPVRGPGRRDRHRRSAGDERGQRLVVAERAARLREEDERPDPSRRIRRRDRIRRAASAAPDERRDVDGLNPQASVRAPIGGTAMRSRTTGVAAARHAARAEQPAASPARDRRSAAHVDAAARCSASAAAYALSLLVSTTARDPGAHARSDRRRCVLRPPASFQAGVVVRVGDAALVRPLASTTACPHLPQSLPWAASAARPGDRRRARSTRRGCRRNGRKPWCAAAP